MEPEMKASEQREVKEKGEYFGVVRWHEDDVREAFRQRGIDPTDEEVSRVIEFCESHHFTDRLIEMGWDVLDTFIGSTFE